MKGTQKTVLLGLAGLGLFIGARMMRGGQSRYDLHGRVAIITGGARGLGLVLARQLAAKGVRLVICSRTEEQLETARRELVAMGASVLAVRCDVTDKSEVNNLIESALRHFGKVDILINNAGVIQVGPIDAMTEHEYDEAMNIHFWAPLYTILATLPHFRARQEGRIVNVASIGGKVSVPHLVPYCASKFALIGLSEGMATELKKENILVSTIVPSLMRTGSPRNITVRGDHEKEYTWFKTAASFPGLSEQPSTVAKKIIEALEMNVTRPTISHAARFASIMKEFSPGAVAATLSVVNGLLPKHGVEGAASRMGYESESPGSGNFIARRADKDAKVNNEL